MEIEQLKSDWNHLDTRLQTLERRVPRLDGETVWNVAVSLLTLGLVGNFLGSHGATFFARPDLAMPGALMMLLAVSTLVMTLVPHGIRHLTKADGAVADVQAELIAYRRLHVWLMRIWVAILVPGWMVFPMLGIQMLLGPRVIAGWNTPWFWANVVFGQLFLVGLWFVPVVRRWFDELSSGQEQLRRLGLESAEWERD